MGFLNGLLGGAVGVELATVVNNLIEKHGGLQGIVSQMESQGLGTTVQSWIGNGANQPISPAQLHQAFGSDLIQDLASKSGLSPQDLANKLSTVLPQVIDKLTPNGTIPPR